MNASGYHVTPMQDVRIRLVPLPVPVILGILEMVSHVLVRSLFTVSVYCNFFRLLISSLENAKMLWII